MSSFLSLYVKILLFLLIIRFLKYQYKMKTSLHDATLQNKNAKHSNIIIVY